MTRRYFIPALYLCGIIMAGTGYSSCTKWTTVPLPNTQVAGAGAFSTDKSADATVVGLYSQIMSGNLYFLDGGTTLYPALSADELYNTSPDASIDPFTQNALSSRNSVIATDLWGKAFSYVYQENACLEGLHSSTAVSEGVRNKLVGEVTFMRALCLFYLTNLYGNIPVPLTTDYTVTKALPRADTVTVYDQIVGDLNDAGRLLETAGDVANETRPSQMACAALAARVYLYRRDWAKAIAKADIVINSGLYSLATPDAVFLAGSTETIFALTPVIQGLNTAEGLNFIPYDPTVTPLYAVQAPLLAAFETGDLRRTTWLDSNLVEGMTYYYPYKYKVNANDDILENNIVLRLAEMYLVRAEARAETNDLAGAAEDVYVIRARAGLPPLAAGLSQTALLDAIAQENRIEFFAEWGHRWLDLKRTNHIDTILGAEKSGWQPTDALYPVPYGEIILNPNLTQNAGY